MKTVPSALATHLLQTGTNLATAFLIVRTDNRKFRSTTGTREVTLDFGVILGETQGDQLFTPDEAALNRTNIANTSNMDVGNLDVVGALTGEQVTEADMRAGLFDFADVFIAFYNYLVPTDGIIKMLRGKLSEVEITTSGAFKVELRDLTTVISKEMGEHYSKECRADVGDQRCKVPVYADIVLRGTSYTIGDFVRASEFPTDIETSITVTNPGAESGTTGWTDVLGTLSAAGSPTNSGAGAFTGGAFAQLRATQSITVPAPEEPFIDANQRTARLRWEAGSNGDRDDMAIAFFDAAGDQISREQNAGLNVSSSYTSRELIAQIPRLTRSIRIAMIMEEEASSGTTDALIDDIVLDFTHDQPLCTAFNDLVYQCTTAGTTDATTQPTYNTGLASTTTDGTAVFTAEEAWTRCFTVTQVDVARTTFQIAIADFPESGGGRGGFPNIVGTDPAWFQFGAAFFETGTNIGRGSEVRNFTTDGGTGDRAVEVFDPMTTDIQVGDTGRISVGCDQRLSTCRAKFDNVINFVGEPFVPGQDFFGQYPDAPA